MLDCPNCGETLFPMSVKASEGSPLSIDHCIHCGSTWFDRYEINRLSYSEIFKISGASDIKKKDMIFGKMERLCPRDYHNLENYKTEVTTEYLVLERCPHCGGVFVSQKALEKFKSAQVGKMNMFKNSKLPSISLKNIFIPFFLVGLLLFSTFLTVSNLKDAKDSQIKAKELLAAVFDLPIDSHTQTIMFETQTPVSSEIKFWSTPFDEKVISVSSVSTKTHIITLQSLKTNTIYSYQVILISENADKLISKVYQFKTLNN